MTNASNYLISIVFQISFYDEVLWSNAGQWTLPFPTDKCEINFPCCRKILQFKCFLLSVDIGFLSSFFLWTRIVLLYFKYLIIYIFNWIYAKKKLLVRDQDFQFLFHSFQFLLFSLSPIANWNTWSVWKPKQNVYVSSSCYPMQNYFKSSQGPQQANFVIFCFLFLFPCFEWFELVRCCIMFCLCEFEGWWTCCWAEKIGEFFTCGVIEGFLIENFLL